jgi:hypothetical protein
MQGGTRKARQNHMKSLCILFAPFVPFVPFRGYSFSGADDWVDGMSLGRSLDLA